MDAIDIFIINSLVAGGACRWEIFKINRGAFVIMLELKMGGVTVSTDCGRKEPFFNQTLSMHTAGVVDQSVSCCGFHDGGLVDFSVTIAAKLRDIGTISLISFVQM
jgi:hypothetical protein